MKGQCSAGFKRDVVDPIRGSWLPAYTLLFCNSTVDLLLVVRPGNPFLSCRLITELNSENSIQAPRESMQASKPPQGKVRSAVTQIRIFI